MTRKYDEYEYEWTLTVPNYDSRMDFTFPMIFVHYIHLLAHHVIIMQWQIVIMDPLRKMTLNRNKASIGLNIACHKVFFPIEFVVIK